MSKFTIQDSQIQLLGFNLTGLYENGRMIALTVPDEAERIRRALTTDAAVMGAFAYIQSQKEDKVKVAWSDYIVESSWIVKLGYANGGLMKVVKKNSSIDDEVTMIYQDVPRGIFDEVLHAESVGGAFNKLVRNKFERVDEVYK